MVKKIEVLDIHKSELPERKNNYQNRKQFLKSSGINGSSLDCTVLLNIKGQLLEVKHSFNLDTAGKLHGKNALKSDIEIACMKQLMGNNGDIGLFTPQHRKSYLHNIK